MLFARLLPLLSLMALSSPVLSQDVKTQLVPKSCAVTRPSEHPFVPPKPYLANGDWFGTDKLWTLRHGDGIWGQGKKTFWFREEWGRLKGSDQDTGHRFYKVDRYGTTAGWPSTSTRSGGGD